MTGPEGHATLPRAPVPRRVVPVLRRHYLKPGELLISDSPLQVATVLGSCVAATFYHLGSGRAGICHAMLPEPARDGAPSPLPSSWRYVVDAIEELVRHFTAFRNRLASVEVKLFGGSTLLPRRPRAGVAPNIGASNIAVARALLAEAGFAVVASDVGGTCGRKLLFDTRTGAVFVKSLHSSHDGQEDPRPRGR